jgi:hypothetical protein
MLRIFTFVLALSCAVIQADRARAEANTIRVAKQFGIAYMQFMVMEDQKMIEKHAKAAGLGDVKAEFNQFRSSDVMNDALLSGSVDFVCLGIPGIITIWSKTKGTPIEVRAASGLNVSPLILLARVLPYVLHRPLGRLPHGVDSAAAQEPRAPTWYDADSAYGCVRGARGSKPLINPPPYREYYYNPPPCYAVYEVTRWYQCTSSACNYWYETWEWLYDSCLELCDYWEIARDSHDESGFACSAQRCSRVQRRGGV